MTEARERPPIRRILVAIDASRQSLEALETAARLAADLSAELLGLFVEDAVMLDIATLPVSRLHGAAGSGPREVDRETMERVLRVRARQARTALMGVAERSRVRWSFKVTRGEAGSEILAAAAECDLITMGRTSAATARAARLGATARSTATAAACAVLLHRLGRVDVTPVAVLYDGAAAALDTAAWFAERYGGELQVLLAEPDPDMAAELEQEVCDRLLERPLAIRLSRVAPDRLQEALRRAGLTRRGLLVLDRHHPLFRQGVPDVLLESLDCTVLLL
jgi:nucleotide-binding universal stress UspA family protein